MGSTYFGDLPLALRRENAIRLHGQYSRCHSRGKAFTAGLFKNQRLALTRYIAGSPIPIEGIRQDSDLLPRILTKGLRESIVNGNHLSIQYALTLLSMGRMIMGGKPVDLSPITNKWEGSDPITDYELRHFWKRLGKPTLQGGSGSFHWSLKSGPNGPALFYSLVDLEVIIHKPALKQALAYWFNDEAQEIFIDWIENFYERIPSLIKVLKLKYPKKLKLRKLSIKEDRESKMRVFAILDWWSQSALKGLHRNLYKLLSGLPTDCTFDQGKHLHQMASLKTTSNYYSFDLSNATDRFPLSLQKRFLSMLVGAEAADHWETIMVKEPFSYKGKSYKYETGQPMGAHSSWPLFALTHHAVIHAAGLRCNIPNFSEYCVLGDDVVIYHDEVASQYKDIMSTLGVEISFSKSHVSPHTFEFAKRWFHHGVEVSPYPLSGLTEVLKSWPLLVEFLGHQVPMKGFRSLEDFGDPVYSELSLLMPSEGKRQTAAFIKRMKIVSAFPNWWLDDIRDPDKDISTRVERLYKAADLEPPKGCPRLWLDWFTKQSYSKIRSLVSEQGAVSTQRAMKWRNALYDIEGDSEADQTSTLSSEWIRIVPPLYVIRSMAIESQVKLNLSGFSLDPSVFWSSWRNLEMMFLPRLNGIFPARKRDGMSKAQSYLALEILKKYGPNTPETFEEDVGFNEHSEFLRSEWPLTFGSPF